MPSSLFMLNNITNFSMCRAGKMLCLCLRLCQAEYIEGFSCQSPAGVYLLSMDACAYLCLWCHFTLLMLFHNFHGSRAPTDFSLDFTCSWGQTTLRQYIWHREILPSTLTLSLMPATVIFSTILLLSSGLTFTTMSRFCLLTVSVSCSGGQLDHHLLLHA